MGRGDVLINLTKLKVDKLKIGFFHVYTFIYTLLIKIWKLLDKEGSK